MGKKDKNMEGEGVDSNTERDNQDPYDQDSMNSQQDQSAQNPMDSQQNQPARNRNGYYGYQNPYQSNWQNQGYYDNDYSKGQQNPYNDYPNYTYQGYQPENANYGSKKKGSVWAKILLGAALGIFIGICAGGTFLVVKTLGENSIRKNTEEAIAETGQSQIDDTKIKETEAIEKQEGETASNYGNLTDVSEIVEKTMPAVVSVNGVYTYTEHFWGEDYSEKYDGGGSGFIIGQNETELLVATNSHVVSDVEDLEVIFVDETTADAVIKGYDNDLDVAVIAVKLQDIPEETKEKIAVAKLGNSTTLKAGQAVISIGNALLMGQSVTTGVISAVNMPVGGAYDDMGKQFGSDDRVMIQTTAFMNPGCSGGVLINASGEVIGINTMAISAEMVEGMCYAIPISDAIPVLDKLKTREIKERLKEEDSGYLGISCTNVGRTQTEEYGIPAGVYISEVTKDSAAEKAGLQKGDVIVKLDGNSVQTVQELQGMLRYYPVGEKVEIEIMRYNKGDYQSKTVEVKLGKRP